MPERIRAPTVANITGYTVRHIQRLAQAGMIPSAAQLVEGGPWAFRETAVRQWLADAEARASRAAASKKKEAATSSAGSVSMLEEQRNLEAYYKLLGLSPTGERRPRRKRRDSE